MNRIQLAKYIGVSARTVDNRLANIRLGRKSFGKWVDGEFQYTESDARVVASGIRAAKKRSK